MENFLNEHVLGRLSMIECRLDTLIKIAGNQGKIDENENLSRNVTPLTEPIKSDPVLVAVEVFLKHLTRNQHATLQMVLNGKTDYEIASRFGIAVNSAKSRSVQIRRRLGKDIGTQIRNRNALIRIVLPSFCAIDDSSYFSMCGLPKDWDSNWTEDDKRAHADLYR